MKWRILILLILIPLAVLSLGRTLVDVYSRMRYLESLKGEVAALEKERGELEEKLGEAKTEEFIEREARDKLGFSREGEKTFVVPRGERVLTKEEGKGGIERKGMAKIPIWREWLRLLW